MVRAQAILAMAAAQLGTKEYPPNTNKVKYNTAYYGREVSGSAYPWCCAFVWWVFREAGARELFYGGQKTASCTTLYHWYKKNGQAAVEPRPGDLVFFNFDGNPSVMNHIGICESVEPGYVTTIDGNTGTDNEANGGAVMRRRRAMSFVGGVARPKYAQEADGMTVEEINALVREFVEKALAERDAELAHAAQIVSPWAAKSWEAATGKGVFDGTKPGGSLTREQAAVVLDRLGLV